MKSRSSVSSLNTCVPEIYIGLSSVSYLMYRFSLKTSRVIWSRIMFKKKILSTEYSKVIYFY